MPWFLAGCRSTSTTGSSASGSVGRWAAGERPGPAPAGGTADPQAIRLSGSPELLRLDRSAAGVQIDGGRVGGRPHARLPGAERPSFGRSTSTATFLMSCASGSRQSAAPSQHDKNEVDGRHRVAVLSDAFWHSHFQRDPSMVGRTIHSSDGAYKMIGMIPVGVAYPVGAVHPTNLWGPLRSSRARPESEAGASPPISSGDCAAETGHVRRPGAGADRPGGLRHRAGQPGDEQGQRGGRAAAPQSSGRRQHQGGGC